MKINCLLAGLLCVLVMTSCSSVRKLSDKDSSVTTTMPKKPRNTQREFLDMEVTAGGMVASSSKRPVVSHQKAEKSAATAALYTKPDEKPASTHIESASMLQLKYAVAMEASVELLTNIALLQVIDKWWGTKYCLGGNTDSCIDCSGFTQAVLKEVYRQSLPRTAQEQYDMSEKIGLEELREGDLVFFNTGGRDISHVGVYLLNNKFVHAATSGGVMISDLNDAYWQPRFRGAGRVSMNYEVRSTK